MDDFTRELQALLNKYNKDTVTKTPGFILARYTEACLKTLEFTAKMRDNWYGKRNVFSGKLVETSDLDIINYAIAEMVKVADRVPLAAYACVAFCDALDGLKALKKKRACSPIDVFVDTTQSS